MRTKHKTSPVKRAELQNYVQLFSYKQPLRVIILFDSILLTSFTTSHTLHTKQKQRDSCRNLSRFFYNHLFKMKNIFFQSKTMIRKHPTSQLQKYLFLGVWSPRKSYPFLKHFEKGLLKNLIYSYDIFFPLENRTYVFL